MGVIKKTSNTHHTSLLVSEHIPDFIRSDHPKFVTFIENYYEFLANNTIMQTSDNSDYYYGVDYASKAITDIHDIDTTDLDKFIESFRRQYATTFPSEVYALEDTRLLYKNILNFYRALGTEDSFKMLFRLLYNEEIEIYYPKEDILIASGGNYIREVRVKVKYTDNIDKIKNSKLIGSTSGAYGTVEDVNILPIKSNRRISGKIANTSSPYVSGVSNSQTYDSDKFLEMYDKEVYVTLTDQHGNFELFESVYYIKDNELPSSISNTTILPVTLRVVFSDDFSNVESANNIVSFDDGLLHRSSSSTYAPWGSANIGFSNTGFWHATGSGQGEIHVYANTFFDTAKTPGRNYLRIGNNTTSPSSTASLRQLVWSGNIPIPSDNVLYKLSVTARDVGGNSAASVAEGNRFSAGVACIRHDFSKIDSEYQDTYDNPLWLASHQQAIDDEFFTYTAYFKGRQQTHDVTTVYPTTNYGNGGRIDLTSGTRYYNSIHKAIEGKVLLPFNTTWFKPTIKVNEPVGATYSQGITDIALVQLEEIGAMQSNFGNLGGKYRDDASLLSTKGAHLQDGYYRQVYAYDIRSQQQMSEYNTVVRKTAHPAGLKMFGTKIVTSDANNISIVVANSNLTESFSPLSINSLAGWWAADKISPDNLQYRKFNSGVSSNSIFGSVINRIPVGSSVFDDPTVDYSSLRNSRSFSNVVFSHTDISPSPLGRKGKLRITDEHTSAAPIAWLKHSTPAPTSHYNHNWAYSDDDHPVVLEPEKKWLVSCYAAVSNTTADGGHNSFTFTFFLANSSGHQTSVSSAAVPNFSSENVWERKAEVIDLSSYNNTRASLTLVLADRDSFVEATGNTVYYFDGFMVEEYDPVAHGAGSPYTPSPFTLPGINGANVVSWYDQSPNKHHTYANVASTPRYPNGLHYPQYVANAFNGQPAIRFRSTNIANTTALYVSDEMSNTYDYTSFGGTVNAKALYYGDTPSTTSPPTSTLRANTMLADPALARPVSNSWTIMVVGKMNMHHGTFHYKGHIGALPFPTPFYSGHDGHRYGPGGGEIKNLDGGSMSLSLDQAYLSGANRIVSALNVNSTAYTKFTSPQLSTTGSIPNATEIVNNYFMFGVSESATVWSGEDVINFHHNGRRYANSELVQTIPSDFTGTFEKYNTEYDGIVWESQNNYRTSIGGWSPANNQIDDSAATYGATVYFDRAGSHQWDGDISEILVFNEKLSNTSIALVEGYVAHKYGLQENLVHKDGTNAANTYEYKWTFANTEDGWIASGGNGSVTKQDNPHANLIFVTAGSGAHQAIEIDFPSHPIDGSGFDEFKIRVMRVGPSTETNGTWKGTLTWKTEDSSFGFTTVEAAAVGWGKVVISGEPSSGSFFDYYADLSALSNWTTKWPTGLKFWFKTSADASETYYIDEISVYNSSRKHHPFRYDAPTSIHKFANNWYKDY